jgi:hypothetical protein
MPETLKLVPDLIPRTSFFKNLRSMLTATEWDRIRRASYERAGHKCEVCGSSQGLLHSHEVWDYDENTGIQKLVGLAALCPSCHEVKHVGLAQVQGRLEQAIGHMMRVNKIGALQARGIVAEAFRIWTRRSRMKWTLDVSALKTLV